MTHPEALVSVIVPAYQAQHTIARTLRSLVTQKDPRWNAVVVDDGSSDRTAEVVRALPDDRISLRVAQHAGVSAARNLGISTTSSPLVCFLDADDTLDPEFMSLMIPAAIGHPLGASCGYRYMNQSGEEILHPVPPAPSDALSLGMLLRLDPPAIMSVLHNRAALERASIDGRVFDPALSSFEDWDLLRRIGSQNKVSWNPVAQTLASYWCTPDSLSTQNLEQLLVTGLKLIDRHGANHPENPHRCREHLLRCLAAGIVAIQDGVAEKFKEQLGLIVPEDIGTLSSALEWHTMRRWGLDETGLATRRAETIERLTAVLGDTDPSVLARLIERVNSWGADPWAHLLDRAWIAVGMGGRVVVFGLGRNGQRALRAARDLGIECVVVDDDPQRIDPDYPKIPSDAILSNDAVIVTPDRHGEISERLKRAGIRAVFTRDCG